MISRNSSSSTDEILEDAFPRPIDPPANTIAASQRPLDAADESERWTTVITAHRGWLDWRLKQLWRYRDLISLFVWRDFTSAYKQTILGPGWHIVQPLLTTLTYTLIFGMVARLPTNGVPPFLFYLSGTVFWNYFAVTLTATSNTFVGNASLLGKVYFHRLTIPLSIAISNLISFSIQLAIFVAALAYYRFTGVDVRFTSWLFAMPLLLMILAGYAVAGGIIVSALTTRYRDLAKLVTFGVQLLMFATPVLYPLSMVPAQYRWAVMLNPPTPLIEGFRLGVFGTGIVSPGILLASVTGMLVLMIVGLMLFTHIERDFMDTV